MLNSLTRLLVREISVAMDAEVAIIDSAESCEIDGSRHTGITEEMEGLDVLDLGDYEELCDCEYYEEYHDFLKCFKECGGNPHSTTIEQIFRKMKSTRLMKAFMTSKGKSRIR